LAGLTLGHQRVHDAIACFMEEAEICARTENKRGGVLGFPTILTVMSCVMAVGEALWAEDNPSITRYPRDEETIKRFCQQLPQRPRWLLHPMDESGGAADYPVGEVLTEVRNGLAHGLGVSADVVLLPTRASARDHDKAKWRIVLPELIKSVDNAIRRIRRGHPDAPWDKYQRSSSTRWPVEVMPARGELQGQNATASTGATSMAVIRGNGTTGCGGSSASGASGGNQRM
jgi:hypothetical protein